MLFFLLILASSSIFSNLTANVIGGLVVLVVTVGGGAWQQQRRSKKEAKKKEEKSNSQKLDTLTELVDEMHVGLVGAKRTPFNPNPAPGALDRIAAIEHTLFTNGGQHNTVLDRLQRLETALKNGTDGVERIETHQSSQEAARVIRANGE